MIVQEKTKEVIKSSADMAKVFRAIFEARPDEDQHKESFYVAGLDAGNRLLYVDLIAIGTVNFAHPTIREAFRLAIIKNAVSLIVSHNHPSGETLPSGPDQKFTRELREAGKLLGVDLLDHIIIGTGYYSFADAGSLAG